MKPDQLREALETCRKEVDNYYKLFSIATSLKARSKSKHGWKMAYAEGMAYIMELRRRKCTVPPMRLEVPTDPVQKELEEVRN